MKYILTEYVTVAPSNIDGHVGLNRYIFWKIEGKKSLKESGHSQLADDRGGQAQAADSF